MAAQDRRRAATPRHGSSAPAGRRPSPSLGSSRTAPRHRAKPARTGNGRLSTPGPRPASGIDRRTLIKGAAGLGAVGVLASALSSLQGCSTPGSEGDAPAPAVVDDSKAVNVTDSYTYSEVAPGIAEAGTWHLPLGTVLSPSEGDWIAATTTGATANPVVSASAFSLTAGTLSTVVEKPVGSSANAVIYEVRCSDSVFAWVELDVVTNAWTLYGAPFSAGALTGKPVELYSADADWDAPLVACSGTKVVWLVMPATGGNKTTEESTCYVWTVGQSHAKAAVTSPGRFATEPTVSDGLVTLAPRVMPDDGVYYGITSYTLSDDLATQKDQLVLPLSVKPFTAVSMGGRFVFQIEANYASGGLLGKMGTFIAEGDDNFVMLSREPSAAAAGKGDVYLVKSRASYIVTDTGDKSYGTLVAANRSTDYGEYPARVGTCDTFVTFCTVKDATTSYPGSVEVRAFKVGVTPPKKETADKSADKDAADGSENGQGDGAAAADGAATTV